MNEYHVVLEAAERYRANPDSLDGIYVKIDERRVGPSARDREGQDQR